MIKIENVEVSGIVRAVYSARNAMNSWERSDSNFDDDTLGPNDHDLAFRLSKAGTDHRKYMRMITVCADITAPLYWYKEYDTYKVGTVANSCSTMHKIHAKEFTLDDFSHENLLEYSLENLRETVERLNTWRDLYTNGGSLNEGKSLQYIFEPKDKVAWEQMIQLLPSSYNQKRTVMLNYEVLANMYHARKNHRLGEWRKFCKWIESLPYPELMCGKKYSGTIE